MPRPTRASAWAAAVLLIAIGVPAGHAGAGPIRRQAGGGAAVSVGSGLTVTPPAGWAVDARDRSVVMTKENAVFGVATFTADPSADLAAIIETAIDHSISGGETQVTYGPAFTYESGETVDQRVTAEARIPAVGIADQPVPERDDTVLVMVRPDHEVLVFSWSYSLSPEVAKAINDEALGMYKATIDQF